MSTHDADPAELRDLAGSVALEVGRFLLENAGETVDATKSSPTDLVTAVDRAAEQRIVEALRSHRPDDGFMGEEGTAVATAGSVRWIIDPIDGTTNFVYRHPGFAVSIAAEFEGTIVAGAVADPVHGKLFDAAIGRGARCNGSPVHPTGIEDVSRAVVATGFSYSSARRAEQCKELGVILPRIADIRRMGSAALDLCGVAEGRVDAFWETDLNDWDIAAGALVASESGAVVKLPAPRGSGPVTFAAAPGIAGDLLELIRSALLL